MKAIIKFKDGRVISYDSIEKMEPCEGLDFISSIIAAIKIEAEEKSKKDSKEQTLTASDIYSLEIIM
ncbi:hypothetical protein [Domibacillus iocasae]|uniref:DUF2922 domain-containing protein n=1 Tax=Domibacillus iocasae TaxID=1714016 RepID=A0A1E7DR30_9BACI|nr:hypothetical protein [Domibacillus iocasae]OES45521.1 hypothetical protein BA724_01500 [Domibacillus iocasae]